MLNLLILLILLILDLTPVVPSKDGRGGTGKPSALVSLLLNGISVLITVSSDKDALAVRNFLGAPVSCPRVRGEPKEGTGPFNNRFLP